MQQTATHIHETARELTKDGQMGTQTTQDMQHTRYDM